VDFGTAFYRGKQRKNDREKGGIEQIWLHRGDIYTLFRTFAARFTRTTNEVITQLEKNEHCYLGRQLQDAELLRK